MLASGVKKMKKKLYIQVTWEYLLYPNKCMNNNYAMQLVLIRHKLLIMRHHLNFSLLYIPEKQ